MTRAYQGLEARLAHKISRCQGQRDHQLIIGYSYLNGLRASSNQQVAVPHGKLLHITSNGTKLVDPYTSEVNAANAAPKLSLIT